MRRTRKGRMPLLVLAVLCVCPLARAAALQQAMDEAKKVLDAKQPVAQEKITEARSALEKAVKENANDPKAPPAKLLLARVNSAEGRFHQAAEILGLLHDEKPQGVSLQDVRANFVLALNGKGDYLRAIEVVGLLLKDEQFKNDPRRPAILYDTGWHYEAVLRRNRDAVKYYRQLVAEHPGSPQAPAAGLRAAYLLEHGLQDVREAVSAYLEAAEKFPKHTGDPTLNPGSHTGWLAGWRALNIAGVMDNSVRTRYGLADHELQATVCGKLAEAFPAKREQIYSHMMDAALLQYSARQLPSATSGKKADTAAAAQWAQKILEVNAKNAKALRFMAENGPEAKRNDYLVAYLGVGKPDYETVSRFCEQMKSVAEVEAALKVAPDEPALLHRAVTLAIAAKDMGTAKKYVERLRALDSDTQAEQRWIGEASLRFAGQTGDLKVLLSLAREPLQVRSVRAGAWRKAIELLAEQHKTDQMIAELKGYVQEFADLHNDGKNRRDYEEAAGLVAKMAAAFGDNHKAAYAAMKQLDDSSLWWSGAALQRLVYHELGKLAYRLGNKAEAARYLARDKDNDDISADCWMAYYTVAEEAKDLPTMLQLGVAVHRDLTYLRWGEVQRDYLPKRLKPAANKLLGEGNYAADEKAYLQLLLRQINGEDILKLTKSAEAFLQQFKDSPRRADAALVRARLSRTITNRQKLEQLGNWVVAEAENVPPERRAELLALAGEYFAQCDKGGQATGLRFWHSIGPFDPAGEGGLDKKYAPEEKIDLKGVYPAMKVKGGEGKPDAKEMTWRVADADLNGNLSFQYRITPNENVVAYAVTFISSPREQDALLFIGSERPFKVFLGGKVVLTVRDPLPQYEPDSYFVKVRLAKGVNPLLVKSVQTKGPWQINARLGGLREAAVCAGRPTGAIRELPLPACPMTELKMWDCFTRAAAAARGDAKKAISFRPHEMLWEWGRGSEARAGYRSLLKDYEKDAREKLIWSYWGWWDGGTKRKYPQVSQSRWLRDASAYMKQYGPHRRDWLVEHMLPRADLAHAAETLDLAQAYLAKHPGDWDVIEQMWETAARFAPTTARGAAHAVATVKAYPKSRWVADEARKRFGTRAPEIYEIVYQRTKSNADLLKWVDSMYDISGGSVRKEADSLKAEQARLLKKAKEHEDAAKREQELVRRMPIEAESFVKKAERAEKADNKDMAQEFRAEADKLRKEVANHKKALDSHQAEAGRLRKEAAGLAQATKGREATYEQTRARWTKHVSDALLGKMAGVTPRVQLLRKMIAVDPKAAADVLAQADGSDWEGAFGEWRDIGRELEKSKQWPQAAKAYRNAVTKPGGKRGEYVDACFKWADNEQKAGAPEAGVKALELVIRRFGDVQSRAVQAEVKLCELYRSAGGDRSSYVAEVHRFLRRYPGNSAGHDELRKLQGPVGQEGGAAGLTAVIVGLNRQILETRDEDARRELNFTRAKMLYDNGRYHEALRGLSQSPNRDTAACILRSACSWKVIDYEAAFENLETARKNADYGADADRTPSTELLLAMAQYETSQEHYPEAFTLLDEARKLLGDGITKDEQTEIKIARTDVLIAQGDMNTALPIIKEVQADNLRQTPYWIGEVQLGKIDFVRERYAEALNRFRKVAVLLDTKASPRALFWIGKTQLAVGETDAAIKSFRELWENYGEDDLIIQAIYLIGRTYRQRGDFVDAIHLFESVGVMRAASKDKVVPGEDVVLRVDDPDYAVGTGKDFMYIEVTTASGDAEQVRVDVNPISQALFVGSIKTKLGDAKPNSGMLEVRGDDVVTIRYLDRFGRMTIRYKGGEIEMDRTATRYATAGLNLSKEPGTSVFGSGQLKGLDQLADGSRNTATEGQLDGGANKTFTVGTRFLRPRLVEQVRLFTTQNPPRSLNIEVLKKDGKEENDEDWVIRKEVRDLEGAAWHDFAIAPSETRAVRIHVLDDPKARGWRRINEMEVIEGSAEKAWRDAEIVVGEAEEKVFRLYVVDTGEVEISSVGFEEEDEEEEEGWQPLAPDEEEEEEEEKHALDIDVARRRAGLITPGNTVFVRLKDKDLDVSDAQEQIAMQAFTLGQAGAGESVRMDTARVVLLEVGPHEGEFQGVFRTAPSGPTASASDSAEGFSPDAAIDKNAGADSVWQAKVDGLPGKWIEVDLKDLYNIGEIRWSRGEGATDRVVNDGSITIYGGQEFREIPVEGNQKANDNVIKVDPVVRGRYVRLTANVYDGNAPAVSQIIVKDAEGNVLVPAEITPEEMRENDVLELNVGDSVRVEYVDEENVEPGKPIRRESNSLDVHYDTADVKIASTQLDEFGHVLEARETARVNAGDVFQVLVQDVDLDLNDEVQKVKIEVGSESGDTVQLEAVETEGDSGTFAVDVQTSKKPEAKDAPTRLYVREGDAVWANYVDDRNMEPGHKTTRTALVFESTPTSARMIPPPSYVVPVPEFAKEALKKKRVRIKEKVKGPTVDMALQDADSAVSPFTRVPIMVGARNSQERRILGAGAIDLEGTLSAPVELTKKADQESPWSKQEAGFGKLLFTDEEVAVWLQTVRRAGEEEREEILEGVPLPVLGDDVIFIQYMDRVGATTASAVLKSLTRTEIEELQEESERTVPAAESAEFLKLSPVVHLVDPETAIGREDAEREKQYRTLMGGRRAMYEEMLSFLMTQRKDLGRKLQEARAEQAARAGEEAGEEGTAELGVGEDLVGVGGGMVGPGELGAETVLTSVEMLQEQLAQVEADIRKTDKQLEFYKQFEVPKEPVQPMAAPLEMGPEEEEETGPYFKAPVPGYPFRVWVTDPDLAAKGSCKVVLRSYLDGLRGRMEVEARPAQVEDPVTGEKLQVMEAIIRTDQKGSADVLPLAWGGTVHVSYEDPVQEFPTKKLRRSYLAFASNGVLAVTQKNFVDAPETLRVGEPLYTVVKDPDRDVSFERDSVLVEAKSSTGDSLVMRLTETAERSGEFRGRIPTAPGEANPRDSILQCDYGGNIDVQYKDYVNLGREKQKEPAALAPRPREGAEVEEEELIESCVEVTISRDPRGIRVTRVVASLLPGSDGSVKMFARNLRRGRLEKETLFSSGYAHYMLGKNFAELGSHARADEVFARARDHFEQLIQRYPGHKEVAHATFYLGNIEFVQENFLEAISYYREVIEKAPRSEFIPQTRLRTGMAYEKLEKTQKAIEQYAYLAFHHKDSPYVKDAMVNMVLYFDKIGMEAGAKGDEDSRDQAFSRLVSVARRFVEKFPEDERAPKLILRASLRMIALSRYADAAELLEEAETTHARSEFMPAFLYWHAEALVKGKVGEEPVERAKVLLQRVVYDFDNERYTRAAKARLIELED